jgi:hypothetical protein
MVAWHWAFGALGVVGTLWAAAWLILGREVPLSEQPAADGSSRKVPARKFGAGDVSCR